MTPSSSPTRRWLTWTAGFLAFPPAGLAAGAVVGPVDGAAAALVGGAVAGAVIGAGQWLAARGSVGPAGPWILASTGGMAIGLTAGAATAGYRTGLGDLALMGLVTGVPLGLAQAAALRRFRVEPAWLWAAAMPALWALGWSVTTAVGVDVERRYAVFGSTGAITVMALAGLIVVRLRPRARRSGRGG